MQLDGLYRTFKGKKGIIGHSVKGEPIYYFKVKKTCFPKIIVQYSIHAREHITSRLAIKQIIDFNSNGLKGTVYFIPLMNPDGVKIALTEKPLYKANANGVDLNVNFDARWGTGECNVKVSGNENFIGKFPFSEPESRALAEFTQRIKPDMTISYHCKGEEIYYEFYQNEDNRRRDFLIAQAVSKSTGYAIKSTPNSAGGYKDWCIEKFKIPAITIEVGSDELLHPIGKESLYSIYLKNKDVIKVVTENEIWK